MAFGRIIAGILFSLFIFANCGDAKRGSRNSTSDVSSESQVQEAAKNTTVPVGTGAIAQSADGLFKLHIPAKGFSDVVVVSIQKLTASPSPSIGVTPTYRVTWTPAEATIREATEEDPNDFTAYFFMSAEDAQASGADNLAIGIRTGTTGGYTNFAAGSFNAEKGAFIANVGSTIGDFTAVDLSKLEECVCDVDTEICDELCACDAACSGESTGGGTGEPCGVGEWQCNDGECILSSYECDTVEDCADGSDEDDHCPENPDSNPGGGTSTITPDEYEPDNSFGQATDIESGVSQTHSLSAGDNDYVTFTLDGYSDVLIETSGSSGDTKLYLYNEANSQIDYNDDGGTGFFSQINQIGLAPGKYYASVVGFSSTSEITSYTITVTVSDPLDPPPTDLQLTWDTENSQIVATWNAPTNGTTSYNVYYDDDALEPFDPAQTANEGAGPINTTETTQALSGFSTGSTVYVAVKAVNSEDVESYATQVVSLMIPLESDVYEEDNSFSTARYIEPGEPQERSIHTPGDYDYVKFTLVETSDVTLETDGTTGDTMLYLYDSDEVQLAYDDMSGNSLFSRISNYRLEPGDYFIMVRAYSSFSTIAQYTLTLSATTAMGTPSSVTATPDDAKVTVSWQAVPGATGYRVYYDDDSLQPFDPAFTATQGASPIEITDNTTTSLEITGLTNETTYYFAVQAIGETQESNYSATVSATPSLNPGDPSLGAPDAPSNVSLSVDGQNLVINWEPVENATGYKVYYDDDPNLPFSPQDLATQGQSPISISENTITLTGLPPGQEVFVAITALNGSLESDFSTQVSGTPEAAAEDNADESGNEADDSGDDSTGDETDNTGGD